MNKTLLTVLILAIVGIGAVMLMNRQNTTDRMTPVEQTMPALEEGATGASGVDEMLVGGDAVNPDALEKDDAMTAKDVKEFTLDSAEFAFDVKTITVNKGDTVKITLTNSGKMPHDWVVDEFNAKTEQITSGETTTVTFVADKAGTYEYYCSVGQHRAQGMVGSLIVK